MKTLIVIFTLFFVSVETNFAQSKIPNSVNLQAIARKTSNGSLAINDTIQVQLTFYPTSLPSTKLIQKIYEAQTDNFGQFQINVDDGGTIVPGGSIANFSNIDWSTGTIHITIEYRDNIGGLFNMLDTIAAGTTFYSFASRTSEELITPGTNGKILKFNGSTSKWEAGDDNNGHQNYIYIEEQGGLSSATNATLGSQYEIRNLNTLIDSAGSLISFDPSTHLIFLPVGSYKVEASATAYSNHPNNNTGAFLYTMLKFESTTGIPTQIVSEGFGSGGFAGNGGLNANLTIREHPSIKGVIKVVNPGGQYYRLAQSYEAYNLGTLLSYSFSPVSATLFIEKIK